MTPHDHSTYVPGCFRCELSRDEVDGQGTQPRWTPPTDRPEAGQGPWMSVDGEKWWVVADRADQALAAIYECDSEAFPGYFAWRAIVEPVLIAWVDPEEWDEESEIRECKSDEPWCAEAWRITFEDR